MSAARATVVTVDGTRLRGRLAEAFTLYAPTVRVDPDGLPGSVRSATVLARGALAVVAVHREPGERFTPPPPEDRALVRLAIPAETVAQAEELALAAPEPARRPAEGFLAFPLDDGCPYRSVWLHVPGLVQGEGARPGEETWTLRRGVPAPSHQGPRVSPPPRRARLGTLLVEAGIVSEADLARAVFEQRKHPGKRLGEVLVAMRLVSERQLTEALAQRFRLLFVDLEATPPDPDAAAGLPDGLLARHRVVAVSDDPRRGLVVALGDPLAVEALDALRFQLRRPVTAVLAPPSQIDRLVGAALGHPVGAGAVAARSDIDAILAELARSAPRGPAHEELAVRETDTGVIRLVNQILADAYRRGASDVHVEPNGARPAVVRLRVDGECVPYHDVPAAFVPALVARLKIMAELDIAERRKPQDGKISLRIGETPVELRVATLPTTGGNEDVVLRILPPQKPRPLADMGLSARNLAALERLAHAPYGLLLCAGPTGSGKTTTLHSILASINTPDMKIWTAEDPVEITQPGLRQLQIHRKIGLDFATAMRSFLRADPDVIMVGEMRDRETASMAIEASLTGHLVLSTLHTNTAPETVVRLLDMGLDPFAFSDSLLGVLAQRLVRTLCPSCLEPYEATEEELETMRAAFGGLEALARADGLDPNASILLWRGRGCAACGGSGYRGRMAIHELLVVDDALRVAISRREGMDRLRALAGAPPAGEGAMFSLLQDGIEKVIGGFTDLRQVLAVCSR